MKLSLFPSFLLVIGTLVGPFHAVAQAHRATHLGNPATRFAPPLTTVADLRSRFADPWLKPDIAAILQQWNWQGDLADLFAAAASAPVSEIRLPNGTRMPFMSSRESGKPVLLRDVLWAGQEPVSAYAFIFSSKGRLYECVTPKPCSNFYLQDLGAPVLGVDCGVPAEIPAGRPVQLCWQVRNSGSVAEPKSEFSISLPSGATMSEISQGGVASDSKVVWSFGNLGPGASNRVCATVMSTQPGTMLLAAHLAGTIALPLDARCETKIVGIPAILIDAVDLEDPVEVGQEVTYDIKVTNQGVVPCTNMRLECSLPENEGFVSGSGPTPVKEEGNLVKTDPVSSFAPKSAVTWRVVVRAVKAGDVRFKVNLFAEEFNTPIFEEESTRLY